MVVYLLVNISPLIEYNKKYTLVTRDPILQLLDIKGGVESSIKWKMGMRKDSLFG